MKEIEGVKMFDLEELTEKLTLTKRTLYNYIKKGKLKSQKIGKCHFVSENNLRKFLNNEP